MKKIVISYVLVLLFLDMCWASLLSYFGASILQDFGVMGDLPGSNADSLSHSGGAIVFIIGLLQSFVFDFIVTIAIWPRSSSRPHRAESHVSRYLGEVADAVSNRLLLFE